MTTKIKEERALQMNATCFLIAFQFQNNRPLENKKMRFGTLARSFFQQQSCDHLRLL
jgi:hypothetical protein